MNSKLVLAAGMLAFAFASAASSVRPSYGGPVRAEECRVRDGIGHVMAKIRAGKPITVAYFGGSITEMDGWRRLSREWLQREYPDCDFREVHAAIGGTGSELGVFRCGHDVLSQRPDLLFIEFATNDSYLKPEEIWANFDGIVRQTWKLLPSTDIVFVYTITAFTLREYDAGRSPAAASAMEQLADYYGIASVDFGPRVAAEVKAGRFVMSMSDVKTAIPASTPGRFQLVIEELRQQGKRLFSKDGVHPGMSGHGLYLEAFKSAWSALKDGKPAEHAKKLVAPFYDARLEAAKMVAIRPEMCRGRWTKLSSESPLQQAFGQRGGQVWSAATPGDKLCFSFKGTDCLIYDLLGPDCGQVWITVDGRRKPHPVPRFDSYSTYYRLSSLPVFKGEEGVHRVEIELDGKQPDRGDLPQRYPNDEAWKRQFDGTKLFACQIELVGDLVD